MSNNFAATPRQSLPNALTSYDLLKFAALALMIIDHVGAIFYPDELWLRVAGRMSAPIWLFLIGYAKSRDLTPPIWIGMIVLIVFNPVVGQPLLPVNILGTMILCRLLLDPVMNVIARNPKMLYPVCTALFFLTLPTFPVIEYGSGAMLLVMLGYMTRNRESFPFTKDQYLAFAFVALAAHAVIQCFLFFQFDDVQKMVVMGAMLMLAVVFISFQPVLYPNLTKRLPPPVVWLVQIGGRHSLAFYVLHILVFKTAALLLGLEGYRLFNFHIF